MRQASLRCPKRYTVRREPSHSGRTGATDLQPVDETRRPEQDEEIDADSVFAKLKSLKTDSNDD